MAEQADWRAMWQAMIRHAQIESRPHMREPRDDVILAADAALREAEIIAEARNEKVAHLARALEVAERELEELRWRLARARAAQARMGGGTVDCEVCGQQTPPWWIWGSSRLCEGCFEKWAKGG